MSSISEVWPRGMPSVGQQAKRSRLVEARDIEDNAQALLRFEDDVIAILDVSYGLTDIHPGRRDIRNNFV